MKVSHAHDHVTHAVIGGQGPMEFGISNSPEFFHILSSTLYSDQILAVVREVLCNAWDAHIEAGKDDLPIEITLGNGQLIVQDFGNGIPHDKIQPIYGVYGNSTKTNDGKQTGGFGLGCKAPFAYTEHFTVASAHKGSRTVYNMSKSQAQVMGKPAIVPVVTTPTDQSGLTVTVPVQPQDIYKFRERIEKVVGRGDIKAKLNGTELETLPFSEGKEGYLIVRDAFDLSRHKLYVRYGNVVYPVPRHTDLEKNWSAYEKLWNKLHYPGALVLQAPPHSISVTPSRESLSMQEHTIQSLNRMLAEFLRRYQMEYNGHYDDVYEKALRDAVRSPHAHRLLVTHQYLWFSDEEKETPYIKSIRELAEYAVRNLTIPSDKMLSSIHQRVRYMAGEQKLPRGLAQSFNRNKVLIGDRTDWYHRRLFKPLLKKLENSTLNQDNFFLRDRRTYSDVVSQQLLPLNQVKSFKFLTGVPLLRNVVVLTTRISDLNERLGRHPYFADSGADFNDRYYLYVYRLGRKKGEIEEAREFFQKIGMTLLDLTVPLPGEKELPKPARKKQASKPRPKGIPLLSSIQKENSRRLHIPKYKAEDVERIEDPEFFIRMNYREGHDSSSFPSFSSEVSEAIVQLFGSRGGIVTTDAQERRYSEKGAKPLAEFLLEELSSYMVGNPGIEAYMSVFPKRMLERLYGDRNRVMKTITTSPELLEVFDIQCKLTEQDRDYLTIYSYYCDFHSFGDLRKILEAAPLHKNAEKLREFVENSSYIPVLNSYYLYDLVNTQPGFGKKFAPILRMLTQL